MAAIARSSAFAQAGGHGGEHLAREGGHRIEHAVELTLPEHEQRHVGLRGDSGGARTAVEQRHLPEVLARPERRHLAVVAPHRGLPLDDQEELTPDGSLLAQHPAGRHGHFLESPPDGAQVLGRRGGEQPDLRKVEFGAHGPKE